MLSIVNSCNLIGIDGFIVNVEVDITRGMPCFNIVGLASIEIKEAKERVKSAIINSDFEFPTKRIVVNLSPADIKKEGSLLDLPISIGLLINYIKREKRIVAIDEKEYENIKDVEELEEKVFKNERAENLKNAIQKLKLEYQNAIYLADIEELSYKEIGHILNKTTSNVKILIYRARRALEKIILEEGYKYEN